MGLFSWLFGKEKPAPPSRPTESFKDKHGSVYVDQEQDRSWIDLSFNPTPPTDEVKWVQLGKRREVAGTHHYMPANLAFIDAVTKDENIDKPHGAILVSEDTDKFDPKPYQVWAWALSPKNRWMIGYVDAGGAKQLRAYPSDMPIAIRLDGLRQWQLEDNKRLYISYSILLPSKPERRKNDWLAVGEV